MSRASAAVLGTSVRYDGRSTITVEGGDGTMAPLAVAAYVALRLERAGITFLFENDRHTPLARIVIKVQSVTPVEPRAMARAVEALPRELAADAFPGLR